MVLPGLLPRRRAFRRVPSSLASSCSASLAERCGHLLLPRHALLASAGSGVGLGAFGTGSPPSRRGPWRRGRFQRCRQHGGVPVPHAQQGPAARHAGGDRGKCPRTSVLGQMDGALLRMQLEGDGWMDGCMDGGPPPTTAVAQTAGGAVRHWTAFGRAGGLVWARERQFSLLLAVNKHGQAQGGWQEHARAACRPGVWTLARRRPPAMAEDGRGEGRATHEEPADSSVRLVGSRSPPLPGGGS